MEEKIQRYIEGTATEAERGEVLGWAASCEENRKELIRRQGDWVFANLPDSDPSESALDRMRSKTLGRDRAQRRLMWGGIAASLIMVCALGLSIGHSSRLEDRVADLTARNLELTSVPELEQSDAVLEYSVNPGVKGSVTLPDGSVVILNSCSTLRTPSRFEDGRRVVEIDGEGYFKVESNAEWPMYVRTRKGVTVKVTGTEFNLSSYSNDSSVKLTLVSGKVALLREGNDSEIAVSKGEEIVIGKRSDSAAQASRKTADLKLNTSWKDGYLVFDNTPISEVIKKMERWYGVTINIQDSRVMDNVFTASFQSESLGQVLDLMKYTCNISYKVKFNEVDLW